jgi:uncharacterized protein YyaL (SSP411 family)
MPNRLAHESSPYLLQHQHNPVDWYPWGEEALARARAEERPIFLSIGYAACHWCHVMEHESFENAEIAQLLNERFVCIKVDREERPDLDQIYMSAVQLLTGRGGWPMSVFLTPELQPFYGGTYWPPHDARGMPGFARVVVAVYEAWQERREQALAQAAHITEHLRQGADDPGTVPLDVNLLQGAAAKLERVFDFRHGGFGTAPKFPHSMDLQLLLRVWQREQKPGLLSMVTLTLDRMAQGGLYDQLGGGFARYSVDERWLVPHFEKMLYDNALLTLAYTEVFSATGQETYATIVRETCTYLLRDLADPAGGFYSTEDADSEGEEGKFYVWTPSDIQAVLGSERGSQFCAMYGVTEHGNFEHGHSILHLPLPLEQAAALRKLDLAQLKRELAEDRQQLFSARSKRVRPGLDDKILVSWNALAIDALARAAGTFAEPLWLAAAERAADFIWQHLRDTRGRLLHTWRDGKAKLAAYADDYAYLINALVSLYEASFAERWIDRAVLLADQLLTHFYDPAGGFFFTADDHETLLLRQKDQHDASVPSGNAMAAYGLLRLTALTGRTDFHAAAAKTLALASGLMQQSSTAVGQMLIATDWELGPTCELVFVGDPQSEPLASLLARLRREFHPRVVIACRNPARRTELSPSLDSLFTGREEASSPEPVLYVCQGQTCETPYVGAAAIEARLARL